MAGWGSRSERVFMEVSGLPRGHRALSAVSSPPPGSVLLAPVPASTHHHRHPCRSAKLRWQESKVTCPRLIYLALRSTKFH